MKELHFAAVGDVHGHMNRFISRLQKWEKSNQKTISFVLQVGDFEPHRDKKDLSTMAAPSKYRELGDFHLYYSGKRNFPWPVYFIGGNHEPYGFLDKSTRGFKVIENCTYIGRSEKIAVKGLNIAGLSGIYDSFHFEKERPSISNIDTVSNKEYIYFTETEVEKLAGTSPIDILMVHEWPSGIIDPLHQEDFEQQRRSLRYDSVGNEYAKMLIEFLEPKLVLCGHMHRGYQNTFKLNNGKETNVVCLASVHEGDEAYAVFDVDEKSNISIVQS